MVNESEVGRAFIVWLDYQEGRPTLWDSGGLGRMKAAWLERASDGAVMVSTDENAIELAESFRSINVAELVERGAPHLYP